VHLVGYFHSCITMHRLMNVKANCCLLAIIMQILSAPKIWGGTLFCSGSTTWRMKHSFGGISIQTFLETTFSTVFGASFIVCLSIMTYLCVSVIYYSRKGREFYVLLTVHLAIIFVNNQLDAQFFFVYVYFYFLHVLGSHVPIIKRINCINTTSSICHSI